MFYIKASMLLMICLVAKNMKFKSRMERIREANRVIKNIQEDKEKYGSISAMIDEVSKGGDKHAESR